MKERTRQGSGRTVPIVLEADTALCRDLRDQVKAYFERAGVLPTASRSMYIKAAALSGALTASYYAFLRADSVVGAALGLGLACGLAATGIIFNVHHDGSHGAWSNRKTVNKVMAASFDMFGMSSFLWQRKHNKLHHSYPNVDGLDDDIDIRPFARLAPDQEWYWYQRYQHIYIWFLYPLLTVKWALFDDFRELLSGKIGRQTIRSPRLAEIVVLATGKAAFVTWVFALPYAVHGLGIACIFFLVTQFTVGMCTALVFQLAHSVEEAKRFSRTDQDGVIKIDWAAHQIAATLDFSRNSLTARWLLGGLNHQVVHHLFPGVSHTHYAALSIVVEAVCQQHSIPYAPDRPACHLLRSHYRWLRRMGKEFSISESRLVQAPQGNAE